MAENASGNNKPGILAKAQRRLARTKTKVLQNLGKAEKTTDDIVNDYVTKVDKQQETGTYLHKELKNYMHCVRNLCQASKTLHACLSQTYEEEWTEEPTVKEQMKAFDLLWSDYAQNMQESVTSLQTYLHSFPTLKNKVAKRGRKMVDFDNARHHMEVLQGAKKRDEVKIQKAQEDLNEAKRIYEQMNNELHTELPEFYNSRVSFYASLFTSMFGSEFVFHSEIGKTYGTLGDISQKLAKDYEQFVYQPKAPLRKSPSYNSTGENGLDGESSSTPSTPNISGAHDSSLPSPTRDSSEPVYHNQDILDAAQQRMSARSIVPVQGKATSQLQATASQSSMFSSSSTSSIFSSTSDRPKLGFFKALKRKLSSKSKSSLTSNRSVELTKIPERVIDDEPVPSASMVSKNKLCPPLITVPIVEEELSIGNASKQMHWGGLAKSDTMQKQRQQPAAEATSNLFNSTRDDEQSLLDKGGTVPEKLIGFPDSPKGQTELIGESCPGPALHDNPSTTCKDPKKLQPKKLSPSRPAPPPPIPKAPLASSLQSMSPRSLPSQASMVSPFPQVPAKPSILSFQKVNFSSKLTEEDVLDGPIAQEETSKEALNLTMTSKACPKAVSGNTLAINLQLLPSVKRASSQSVSTEENKVWLSSGMIKDMSDQRFDATEKSKGLGQVMIDTHDVDVRKQSSITSVQSYYQTVFISDEDLQDDSHPVSYSSDQYVKTQREPSCTQEKEQCEVPGKRSLLNLLEAHLRKKHNLPSDSEAPYDSTKGTNCLDLQHNVAIKSEENLNAEMINSQICLRQQKLEVGHETKCHVTKCVLHDYGNMDKDILSNDDLLYPASLEANVFSFAQHHPNLQIDQPISSHENSGVLESSQESLSDFKITEKVLDVDSQSINIGASIRTCLSDDVKAAGKILEDTEVATPSVLSHNDKSIYTTGSCDVDVSIEALGEKGTSDYIKEEDVIRKEDSSDVGKNTQDGMEERSDSPKQYFMFDKKSWHFGSLVDIFIPDSFQRWACQTRMLMDKCVPSITGSSKSLSNGGLPNISDCDVVSIVNRQGSSVDSSHTNGLSASESLLTNGPCKLDISLNRVKELDKHTLNSSPVTRMEWEAKRQCVLQTFSNSCPDGQIYLPLANPLRELSLQQDTIRPSQSESSHSCGTLDKTFENVLTDIVSMGATGLRKIGDDKTVPLWKVGRYQRDWTRHSCSRETVSCRDEPVRDKNFNLHDAMLSRLQMSVPLLNISRERKLVCSKAGCSQDSLDRYESWDSTLSGDCSSEFLDAEDCRQATLPPDNNSGPEGKAASASDKNVRSDPPAKTLQESLAIRRSLLTDSHDDDDLTYSSSQDCSD